MFETNWTRCPSMRQDMSWQLFETFENRDGLAILYLHKNNALRNLPHHQWELPGPRYDEVDNSIVYYWCNIRVKGNEKSLQKEKLKETVSAEGQTESFSVESLPKGMDLEALGHKGPTSKEEPPSQAQSSWYWCGTSCSLHVFFLMLFFFLEHVYIAQGPQPQGAVTSACSPARRTRWTCTWRSFSMSIPKLLNFLRNLGPLPWLEHKRLKLCGWILKDSMKMPKLKQFIPAREYI